MSLTGYDDVAFQPWPKIARLNRDVVITEKIDGTNAAIGVTEDGFVYAQSRTRIITPDQDNFGFARWVYDHQADLAYALGPGLHFGEWWGLGIQRGYGLEEKRFSLFNTARYGFLADPDYVAQLEGPQLVHVVPVLYEGPIDPPDPGHSVAPWEAAVDRLRWQGSVAAPGFKKPEGIVVFHTAAKTMFKVTLEGDEKPKGQAA